MRVLTMLSIVVCFSSTIASAKVISGPIKNWCESESVLSFGATKENRQVQAWWSIDEETGNTAYFYGVGREGNPEVELAIASGVTDISVIKNASTFSYTAGALASIKAGTLLLYHNMKTNHYAAIKVDKIKEAEPNTNCPYASVVVNGTWYFQDDGTANFSKI